MLYIMIFLINFLHFMIYIFIIFLNNIDFFFSCVDVLHIYYYNMLFNVIIHMSLSFYFFLCWVFSFLVRLSHISLHLFQWTLFLNYLLLNFTQFVLINLLILLMHLMTVLELIFFLILLICDAFLSLLSMQVVVLLISNHRWLFIFIKIM